MAALKGILGETIRSWDDRGSLAGARSITLAIVSGFWKRLTERNEFDGFPLTSPSPNSDADSAPLPEPIERELISLGEELARLPVLEAAFEVGSAYTSLLPSEVRSEYGVFYTHPVVADHLLDRVEQAGLDWTCARVLDPACGGGAFVASVARRIRDKASEMSSRELCETVSRNLRGWEIDPFSAWLTVVFTEALLIREIAESGLRFSSIVQVADSLSASPSDRFDLVIANPPFGKTRLSPEHRKRFARSLFGHANLYGLFFDQALRLAAKRGLIAFVSPASYLSGEYFKKLRSLLDAETTSVSFDFLESRNGIFDGVLQETLLSVFRKHAPRTPAKVFHIPTFSLQSGGVSAIETGVFDAPPDPSTPWLMPRNEADAGLFENANRLPNSLPSLGYRVRTGPLVWNRHKHQLTDDPGEGHLPLIWAESVSSTGNFSHSASRRNHTLYFRVEADQDWLVCNRPCLLLQRTTAKEQKKRLVSAVLDDDLIARSGGVVVENHLNMVQPVDSNPAVGIETIAAILNSSVIDRIFRGINGSVAVSAFELESIPLPSLGKLKRIERLVEEDTDLSAIDRLIEEIYHR